MAPNDELAAIQAALRLQPQSSRGEVVTETELAAALGTAAAAAAADVADLDTRKVGIGATVRGGVVPQTLRVPHLVIDQVYPRANAPHRVVWAEPGGTMYASARDKTFYKSTDHGKTWTATGATSGPLEHPSAFLKLANGNLLAVLDSVPNTIIRSTDDGATWATVHTCRANAGPMGPSSWCEDQSGHVYYGEYQITDTFVDIKVVRSTDGGATWSTFHTFPGPATSDPARIRHVHGVQYDLVSQRVFVTTGDSQTAAGIYRTNATTGATALERVVDNSQLTSLGSTQARSIGLMFFPNSLAWGVDGTNAPNLVRMDRSQIATATPAAQIVYALNSTAWFTTRAATDNTAWLLSASKEGADPIDRAVHLYAIEDEGRRVYEVGSIAQCSASTTGGIAAVGKPEMHGDRMWLLTYNVFKEDGDKLYTQFAARLARGAQPLTITAPPEAPAVLAWQSVASGLQTIVGAQSIAIGQTRSGAIRRTLRIHDWCVRRSTGAGTARLSLFNLSTTAEVWTSTVTGTIGSQRSTLGRDDAPWIDSVTGLAASQALEWRIVTTADFTGNVQVTYGWDY